MGRSVSVPSNAYITCYQDVSEIDDEFGFEDLLDDIQWSCRDAAPSLRPADRWIGREDHVILENDHVEIGVSEYCGLAAIWVVVKEDRIGLATHWADVFSIRFRQMFGQLRHIGTASNGEAFFQRL